MKKIIPIILILFSVFACDDIFENDISKDDVQVVAPRNNAMVQSGDISFCWRELIGATRYRITIVSPSFELASTLIADTIINTGLDSDTTFVWGDGREAKGVKMVQNLSKGDYEWSICAFNSGYTSKEQTMKLTVEEDESNVLEL